LLPAPIPTAPVPATAKPPAHQVAAAIARLNIAPAGARLELTLHPAELGHVQIRITRALDGHATVHVQVERPETLAVLHRDASGLQAALDRAGLAPAARNVTLALAPPAPQAATAGSAGTDTQPRERRRPRPGARSRAALSVDATQSFPAVNITA
jgi:flagellar hook-length control protein FliK